MLWDRCDVAYFIASCLSYSFKSTQGMIGWFVLTDQDYTCVVVLQRDHCHTISNFTYPWLRKPCSDFAGMPPTHLLHRARTRLTLSWTDQPHDGERLILVGACVLDKERLEHTRALLIPKLYVMLDLFPRIRKCWFWWRVQKS